MKRIHAILHFCVKLGRTSESQQKTEAAGDPKLRRQARAVDLTVNIEKYLI